MNVVKYFNGKLSSVIITSLNVAHTNGIDGCTPDELSTLIHGKNKQVDSNELNEEVSKRLSSLYRAGKVKRLPKRKGRSFVYYTARSLRTNDNLESVRERVQNVEDNQIMASLKVMVNELDNKQLAQIGYYINNMICDRYAEQQLLIDKVKSML